MSDLKLYYRAIVIKNCMVLVQQQTVDQGTTHKTRDTELREEKVGKSLKDIGSGGKS
uniref:Uncharacterized protein n=1 Tax=Trichinella nativa TaxID=6335 RepID=A0A0V1KII0_9BILA